MKFRYTSTLVPDTRGKMTKRPVLELELLNARGEFVRNGFALVDSGADTTMVNSRYASLLGVDLTHARTRAMAGIAKGGVPTQVASLRFRIKGSADAVEIPALYIDSENVDILLGQEVFFDTHKIKFEKDHDVFEITKVKK